MVIPETPVAQVLSVFLEVESTSRVPMNMFKYILQLDSLDLDGSLVHVIFIIICTCFYMLTLFLFITYYLCSICIFLFFH